MCPVLLGSAISLSISRFRRSRPRFTCTMTSMCWLVLHRTPNITMRQLKRIRAPYGVIAAEARDSVTCANTKRCQRSRMLHMDVFLSVFWFDVLGLRHRAYTQLSQFFEFISTPSAEERCAQPAPTHIRTEAAAKNLIEMWVISHYFCCLHLSPIGDAESESEKKMGKTKSTRRLPHEIDPHFEIDKSNYALGPLPARNESSSSASPPVR